MNKPKGNEYRSAVYTNRPDYADFDESFFDNYDPKWEKEALT